MNTYRFQSMLKVILALSIIALLVSCQMLIEQAITGVGGSADVEDTGFFLSYDGFTTTKYGLPDLCYWKQGNKLDKYKKVLVLDFTSLNTNIYHNSALSMDKFVNLKKSIPDAIASSFDSQVFDNCERSSVKIKPKDIAAIKKMNADAIIMGNIKELKHMTSITTCQYEFKLIDRRSGQEVIKVIDRNATDADKIATMIVYKLSRLMADIKKT